MSISSRLIAVLLFLTIPTTNVLSQRRRAPAGGRVAIVVDERLAALRDTPSLSGVLIRRLSRGRLVAIRLERRTRDGIIFARVNVSNRTTGWIQRDAVVIPHFKPDEEKLLRLIRASKHFDRIVRARIFLDEFPRSAFRPEVLLLFGDAAEAAAANLSRDAVRRLTAHEVEGSVPEYSYFLNYAGLDRYNRQGIRFVFNREEKKFHYDGAVWKELLRHYPRAPEADEARKRLTKN